MLIKIVYQITDQEWLFADWVAVCEEILQDIDRAVLLQIRIYAHLLSHSSVDSAVGPPGQASGSALVQFFSNRLNPRPCFCCLKFGVFFSLKLFLALITIRMNCSSVPQDFS